MNTALGTYVDRVGVQSIWMQNRLLRPYRAGTGTTAGFNGVSGVADAAIRCTD
jgi:hypothetical protein